MRVLRLLCVFVLFSTILGAWVGKFVKVAEVFSSGSQLYVGGRYFADNSKALGQKAALLNAITLAKAGDTQGAKSEIALMAVQVAMYDLPNTVRQALGFWNSIMAKDQSFAANTVDAGKKYVKAVSADVQQAVDEFYEANPNPSVPETTDLRKRLKDVLTKNTATKQARDNVLAALDGDMTRAQRLSEAAGNTALKLRARQAKAWFQGFKTEFKKNLGGKFLGQEIGSVGVIDPMVDAIGIGLSINGIVASARTGDTKGLAINIVGLIASVVGVVSWLLAVGGVPWAGPVNVVIGLVAAIVMLAIELGWRNPTIEAANEFSKVALQDLAGTLQALDDSQYANSFGWVYQANTGIFLLGNSIAPDSPIRFRQPQCVSQSTPCDPKTSVYNDDTQRFLVLGTERRSTDDRFTLDIPFDFVGRPKDRRFCGNTISLNALTYYNSLNRRNIRVYPYVRSLDIDTTTLPDYNEVDSSNWDSRRDQQGNLTHAYYHHRIGGKRHSHNEWKIHKKGSKDFRTHKRQTKKNKGKKEGKTVNDPVADECSPNSDRIEIDLLRKFDPRSDKKVRIRTGDGKDILSIGGLVGEPTDGRTSILDADLGTTDEANIFSLGYGLNIADGGRSGLIAGVKFDNTGGRGQVCYLKHDLITWRCVGNVRGVTVFKGSRLHDTVVLGGYGPKTVLQHYGANEYHFKIQDLVSVLDPTNKDDMCPDQWRHHGVNDEDFCYLLLDTQTETWDEAREDCQEQGAALVSVHNSAENTFVSQHKTGARWLGLTDSNKERSYKWVDGTNIDDPPYLKFAANQNEQEGWSCNILNPSGDKEWSHSTCDGNRPFTCKKVAEKAADGASQCSEGWSSHTGQLYTYCYKAFGVTDPTEEKTWFEAVQHCRDLEAGLTSITDEAENDFVAGLMSQTQWIGLEDNRQQRFFYWTDGSRREGYSNWASGQPDDNDYTEHCVMLEAAEWKTTDCKGEKRFTCEKLPEELGPKEALLAAGGLREMCEDGWQLHDCHCFKAIETAMTWSEAETHCSGLDAVLARPNSAGKNTFIDGLHSGATSWIGLSDRFKDRTFSWIDETPFDYANWLDEDASRDQDYSYKHCVTMDTNGKWTPYKCEGSGAPRSPMCKKKAHERRTFELLDISKDGRPVVKVFLTDSMGDTTIQYDKQNMLVDIKSPTHGHMARIKFSRDNPLSPEVFLVRDSSQPSCVGHSVLVP